MISRLHYITQELPGISTTNMVEQACKGGVEWVQLRIKEGDEQTIRNTALEVQKICNTYGAKLIINDHVHLALELNADGVHLGRQDMPPESARKILGKEKFIGGTANSLEDMERLTGSGVDYIGLGPYRFTTTKKRLNPVLGLSGIEEIMKQSINQVPIIAIGGIRHQDVDEILHAGAYGIAVSSAINKASDVTLASKNFVRNLKSGFI